MSPCEWAELQEVHENDRVRLHRLIEWLEGQLDAGFLNVLLQHTSQVPRFVLLA